MSVLLWSKQLTCLLMPSTSAAEDSPISQTGSNTEFATSVNCARYRRASHDATVKLAAVLDMVGAAWAIVYLVATLLLVLLPASAPAVAPLGATIQLSILFAVIFLLVGSTLPSWGPRAGVPAHLRHLRLLLAYWRLRALWHALVAEAPTVILPLPVRWWSALFAPDTLDLVLYRQVIEILDAWRQLDGVREMHEWMTTAAAHAAQAPRSDTPRPPMRTHAPDQPAYGGRAAVATDAQTQGETLERCARTDARHIVETLEYLRRHPGHQEADRPLMRGMVTAYQPTTYVEHMRYLERVACYLRVERRRRPAQQR